MDETTAIPRTDTHYPDRALFLARDYITGDPFYLVESQVDGLVRTTPQPPPDRMERYYPLTYYGQDRRYSLPVELLLNLLYRFRARSIERSTGKSSGAALDVGCGRGLLLNRLRALGWNVTGTELSEESARYAREILHLDVKIGDLLHLHLPADAYDLIILWHVLEHVPHPAPLLHEIARLLRPGGTLLVATPNFASPEARWSRARWFHLDVPRHLTHFTPRALRTLLIADGLEPIKAHYVAPEYDLFSFVQTALNMTGIRHNLLYDLLRTRGAKVLLAATPPSRLEIALTLLLAPLLGALGLLWTPLAALLHQGATVTIYARKPNR